MSTPLDKLRSVDVDDIRHQALQRLAQSRARLTAALLPAPRSPRATPFTVDGDASAIRRLRALWDLDASKGSRSTIVSTATSLLRDWWGKQPWHATTDLIGQAVSREVSPWVRRHPVASLALGFGVGAAIAVIRPWRWHLVQSRSRRMGGTMGRWAIGQLAQPAVQLAVVAALTAWLDQRKSAADSNH